MENSEQQDKCQHPGCKCTRPSVGDFCSDHCKNAQGEDAGGCGCGHPSCS